MFHYMDDPTRTLTASDAIEANLRVTYGASGLALADENTLSFAVLDRRSTAAGQLVPARLRTAQGTRYMVAAGEIAAGATCYAAAAGKVAASGTVVEGIALEAATGNNDVFEVALL